jgi:ABC-type glycerol-3-phosphate transport system permease component
MKGNPVLSLLRWTVVAVLALIAVIAIYPLLFMALSSIKTSTQYIKDPIGLPRSWSYFENYRAMFTEFGIAHYFWNTAVCILGASMLTLGCSIPASFAFAKLRFPLRGPLRLAMIATLIVPAITFIVPAYVMMAKFDLISTYRVVMLLWAATTVPSNIFLLGSLMQGIPNDILEAAKIDGAGYWETMRRAVIPLSAPGIVTVSIFNVTTWWNDLLIPLIFLQTNAKMTVTVGVSTVVGRFSTDIPLLITGLLLSCLPPLVVYLLLQGIIRRGLVIGAVR